MTAVIRSTILAAAVTLYMLVLRLLLLVMKMTS
jgi:hypothetical protein